MKAAIPVFQNKIAPRLDCAEEFLIFEINEGTVKETEKWECRSTYSLDRAITLADSEVDVIICGAIDRCSSRILEAKGKKVFPWHYGEIRLVIEEFVLNGFSESLPVKPKCCKRRFGRKKVLGNNNITGTTRGEPDS